MESIHRVSETEWKQEVVLPSVSFAPLILPSQESVKDLEALEIGENDPLHPTYISWYKSAHNLVRAHCNLPFLPLLSLSLLPFTSGSSCAAIVLETILPFQYSEGAGPREVLQNTRTSTATASQS